MFLQSVVSTPSIQMMDKMLAFTEARHQVLAENIANVDTPGYATRHLDPAAFQNALREALDESKASPEKGFALPSSRQFSVDEQGRLEVDPTVEPAGNLLFHDRTNIRIEEQMADLAENAMMHQLTSEMLRSRYEGLTKAIRGRVA